jgi:hypothetical protein
MCVCVLRFAGSEPRKGREGDCVGALHRPGVLGGMLRCQGPCDMFLPFLQDLVFEGLVHPVCHMFVMSIFHELLWVWECCPVPFPGFPVVSCSACECVCVDHCTREACKSVLGGGCCFPIKTRSHCTQLVSGAAEMDAIGVFCDVASWRRCTLRVAGQSCVCVLLCGNC